HRESHFITNVALTFLFRPPVILARVFGGRMMLQHYVVTKHATENRRGLVNDRCERDGIHDAVQAVHLGMGKSEAERGERLAAPSGHVEREHATRQDGLAPRMVEDISAQTIKPGITWPRLEARHVYVEAGKQAVDNSAQRGPVAVDAPAPRGDIEIFGVAI